MERRGGSFFGRRKGKALRPGQRTALETVLPALLVDLAAPPPEDLRSLFPEKVDAVRLEIGFGGGEHLLHAARNAPRVGFIGVEPFEAGIAKAVVAIAREQVRNIRLFDQDATLLLDWLPAASLAGIDLLFADPWPKKRHFKRRFVNAANLDRIVRCLEAGGVFRFATDVESYLEWTLAEVEKHGGLTPVQTATADRHMPWADWPGTRYETKAVAAGRRPAYLTFRKPI